MMITFLCAGAALNWYTCTALFDAPPVSGTELLDVRNIVLARRLHSYSTSRLSFRQKYAVITSFGYHGVLDSK